MLGKQLLIFDGGMGSELERAGLGDFDPMELNLTHPEAVCAVHRAYAQAGADVITANSFGLNAIKYRGKYALEELVLAAVRNARSAGKPVYFDVGPTGALLAPVGTLTFEEAYEAYAHLARLTSGLVDGYIAETFSDLLELKACILALKEHTDRPVFATMTFDGTGRTLTGSTPEIAALTLEGLGVDALGVNCSLGPAETFPVAERMLAVTTLPVIVQPNRGLPVWREGRTVYELSDEVFAQWARRFARAGVAVLGGCCGTTPDTIRLISSLAGAKVPPRRVRQGTAVCSATRLVTFDGVRVCGERMNPTGKPKLQSALRAGDFDCLVAEAVRQEEAGADLLDLNVGLPGIDERAAMWRAVKIVQGSCPLPLQLDSSDAGTLEAGARCYAGIPLLNSVNGEEAVMNRIFPIAKKYGAVVIGLTMDAKGVPRSARERAAIARRILARAEECGIPRHKVMIDTLVLTASAEQALVGETLSALARVSAKGIATALGVSNVSFGLPMRPLLNRTFLAMALQNGLTMPILNPLDAEMMGTVRAFRVLSAQDAGAEEYIRMVCDAQPVPPAPSAVRAESGEAAGDLSGCILHGRVGDAARLAEEECSRRAPLEVVDRVLIPALDTVGRDYAQGRLYLPQLIAASEAAKAAFAAVEKRLGTGSASRGKVVLATVRGDVHDIGKNIVKVVAQSHGYTVIDLGKDVPKERIVEAVQREAPMAVGLSALMTTTVRSMEETIAALRRADCMAKIFVGGAVLNAQIADRIGADAYTADAPSFAAALDAMCAASQTEGRRP